MNNYKLFKNIGLTLSGLSVLTLLFNFFKMYNLVGNCPNGSEGCAAYSHWQLINKVGIVLLVIGIAITVWDIVRQRHNK